MRATDISSQIVDSATRGGPVELGLDVCEFAVDQLLDDSILKDVPVVGWIIKAKHVCTTVSERLLLAKIARFLLALPRIPEEKRRAFRDQLANDPKLKARVCTKLLLLLDHMSDLAKCDILAKVFSAYLRDQLTYDDFSRLAEAIELSFAEDLAQLAENDYLADDGLAHNLLRSGLTQISTDVEAPTTLDSIKIKIPLSVSRLGNMLHSIMRGGL